jgi:hypothetical protein
MLRAKIRILGLTIRFGAEFKLGLNVELEAESQNVPKSGQGACKPSKMNILEPGNPHSWLEDAWCQVHQQQHYQQPREEH